MITKEPIQLSNFFVAPTPKSCGAIASFVGIVRNHDQGRSVTGLYYDCYESMANRVLESIRQDTLKRYEVTQIHVLHRVGFLPVGQIAIAVAVASAHRKEAFAACEAMVDQIKHRVPIWKKEFFSDGTHAWVSCRHETNCVVSGAHSS